MTKDASLECSHLLDVFMLPMVKFSDKINHDLDKCKAYSTESCEWTKISSMNTNRCAFTLVYIQDKTWAIGGLSNKKELNTIETYDLPNF